MTDDITDGFGNWWSKCDLPNCDLHVVRPGDARCDASFCKLGREWMSEPEDITDRLRTVIATPHGVDIWTTTALEAADEIERLRAAGDALYELVSVRLIVPADQHDDAVEQIRKWKEARRG